VCAETAGSSVQPWQDPASEPSGVRAELLPRALENRSTGALSTARLPADATDVVREHGCLLHLPRGIGPRRGRGQPVRAGMGLRVPGHGWRRRSRWGGSGRRWKPFLLALWRDDRWWMSEGEKQTAGARGRGGLLYTK